MKRAILIAAPLAFTLAACDGQAEAVGEEVDDVTEDRKLDAVSVAGPHLDGVTGVECCCAVFRESHVAVGATSESGLNESNESEHHGLLPWSVEGGRTHQKNLRSFGGYGVVGEAIRHPRSECTAASVFCKSVYSVDSCFL